MKTILFKRIFPAAMLYGGLLIFFISTDPHKLAIGWLLVPFLWLFIAIFWTLMMLFGYRRHHKRAKKIIVMSTFGATMPTLALLLDSINQFTIRDGLLIVTLSVVGFFYVSRLNFRS